VSKALRLSNVTWERTGDDLMLRADVVAQANAAPAAEAAVATTLGDA
jgi:hypothetical protein